MLTAPGRRTLDSAPKAAPWPLRRHSLLGRIPPSAGASLVLDAPPGGREEAGPPPCDSGAGPAPKFSERLRAAMRVRHAADGPARRR